MRVLVVDDDPDLRLVVRVALEGEGFEVIEAADADEALQSTAATPVDVAVLDLRLPDTSGLELLTLLRQRDAGLYVIMLTAASSEGDRVLGLVSGADDYMVKPFSVRELAARVIAAGRRQEPRQPLVEAGSLRIDVASRTVTFGGEAVDLTRREFDLLLHLAAHPGQMFTRPELLHAVWASSSEWQSEATVTEHVRRLHGKIELDPASPVRIVTVRGMGYRFEPAPSHPNSREQGPANDQLAASGAGLSQDATVVVVGNAIVYASAATLTLLGANDPTEVVGRNALGFVAPQSLGASVARQQSAAAGRWPRPEVITLTRLDGAEVLVEIVSMPVSWEGTPASQITLWDLAADTSKLRELATGIRTDVSDAIIITDAQLRIQSFNAAAEELYGWREEEVIGRDGTRPMPSPGCATTSRQRCRGTPSSGMVAGTARYCSAAATAAP